MTDDTGPVFWLAEGDAPLLVSMPHIGTGLPQSIAERLTPLARQVSDTDWHVDRLYDFAAELGAHRLGATRSRYVIDLNRPPDDASLYPGQATTGLCPATDFDGVPLYQPGGQPDAAKVADRRQRYWQPYHDALADALARIVAKHGYALLYDAHSIRSRVPRLFDGELATLNIGTADGRSCDPVLERRVAGTCRNARAYSKSDTSPAPTARRQSMSTPSRWSWRSEPIWMNHRPTGSTKRGRQESARSCGTCSGSCWTGAPRLTADAAPIRERRPSR